MFKKNLKLFSLKLTFLYMFFNYFDVIISRLIFLKIKNYFNLFLNKTRTNHKKWHPLTLFHQTKRKHQSKVQEQILSIKC